MFLPKQAGVIELFPKDTLTTNNQYKIIARWRQLYYISWQNTQPWNDIAKDGSTYIPLNVISFLLTSFMDDPNPSLMKMIRSCKCFPHASKIPTLTYSQANNVNM
jgi:hypothetical protein